MTTKEAIARLKAIVFEHTDDTAINTVLNALRASQKRERDTWALMATCCSSRRNLGQDCRWKVKCTRRNCPLLKEKR